MTGESSPRKTLNPEVVKSVISGSSVCPDGWIEGEHGGWGASVLRRSR